MKTFTHSGSTGDIISSLAVVNILGGGDYYLRLNNMDNVSKMIGWPGAGRHSGRMTQDDYDQLAPLMKIQHNIRSFKVWNGEQVDYELEKQVYHHNPPGWPRSFSRQYGAAVGLDLEKYHKELNVLPFLEVDTGYTVPGRNIMIGRNKWYLEGTPDPANVEAWNIWKESGLADQSFYCGRPEEHAWFEETLKIKVPYVATEDCLQLARYMKGAEMVISNQSLIGTMAVSMGKSCWIEVRKNVELTNNEIYYPYRINAHYF